MTALSFDGSPDEPKAQSKETSPTATKDHLKATPDNGWVDQKHSLVLQDVEPVESTHC